jgi:hypothetical protein
MSEVTYGRLEDALRSLGFSLRGVEEKNKVYGHEPTGAVIVIPEFSPGDPVLARHLTKVRGILEAYGIADPLDFATKLQRAS